MNFSILNDNDLADECMTLSPHYNIPDLSKPFSVSGNLTLLNPANNILGNLVQESTDLPPDTILDKLDTVEVEI